MKIIDPNTLDRELIKQAMRHRKLTKVCRLHSVNPKVFRAWLTGTQKTSNYTDMALILQMLEEEGWLFKRKENT